MPLVGVPLTAQLGIAASLQNTDWFASLFGYGDQMLSLRFDHVKLDEANDIPQLVESIKRERQAVLQSKNKLRI